MIRCFPVTIQIEPTERYRNIAEEYGKGLKTEELDVKTREGVVQEGTVGNTLSTGKRIWLVLTRGLNPFPIVDEINDPVEKYIFYGLGLLRSLMYLIVGIELYMVMKNRKTN